MRNVFYYEHAEINQLDYSFVASKEGLVYFNRRDTSLMAPIFSLYPHRMMMHDHQRLAPYIQELKEYLRHEREYFDLPLDYSHFGTPLQRLILDIVRKIPYGMTCTYSEIAAASKQVDSVRLVAHAIALNPLPIFIPCHRVIFANAADGDLQINGLNKKELLNFERGSLHAIS